MAQAEPNRWRQAAGRVPLIDQWLRKLRRSDEIAALQTHLTRACAGSDAEPFLVRMPPGHFYSPVPSMKEIKEQEGRIFGSPDHLVGLDLNEDAQLDLLATLAPLGQQRHLQHRPPTRPSLLHEQPVLYDGRRPDLPGAASASAAASLPRDRLGWSTALALDTNDQWLGGTMQVTCIEPYPKDLKKLLRPGDDVEVLECGVQEVEPQPLRRARAPGDVLFIDCSHVVKTGSNAHHLITRVLPMVPVGVYIHIHDIFWAFEYPKDWVYEGHRWNEAYLLHAFLLFNPTFEIILFNDWLLHERNEVLGGDPGPPAGGGRRAVVAPSFLTPERQGWCTWAPSTAGTGPGSTPSRAASSNETSWPKSARSKNRPRSSSPSAHTSRTSAMTSSVGVAHRAEQSGHERLLAAVA